LLNAAVLSVEWVTVSAVAWDEALVLAQILASVWVWEWPLLLVLMSR
jgi:hypothetical protein